PAFAARATAAAGQANAELSGLNHGDGGPTKAAPKRTSRLAVRTLHGDFPCRLVLSRCAVRGGAREGARAVGPQTHSPRWLPRWEARGGIPRHRYATAFPPAARSHLGVRPAISCGLVKRWDVGCGVPWDRGVNWDETRRHPIRADPTE